MKFNVEKMENGNYLVQVIRNDNAFQDDIVVIERAYDEIGGIISLLLATFDPV